MDIQRLIENAQELLTEARVSAGSSYDRGVEGALDRLGLQRKHSATDIIFPALGIFGAGLAVGASLGLLFAPKRGDEIRSDIAHRLEDLTERINGQAEGTVAGTTPITETRPSAE